LSPTNTINPVNYSPFIDPDPDDHRIPLPVAKWDVFLKDFKMETVYIPIFQSAVMDPWGQDLAFIRLQQNEEAGGEATSMASQFSQPYMDPILENFTVGSVDYREDQLYTGEAAVKLGYRFLQKNQVEVLYFNTREDFPVILYSGQESPFQPDVLGILEEQDAEETLDFDFDRYEMYGATFKTHLLRMDFLIEYAWSPERAFTRYSEEETPVISAGGEESTIIQYETFKETREWQAVALEIDYLDPNGNFFAKVGAEQVRYLDAPDKILFPSDDTIYLLGFLRAYFVNDSVIPEFRMIKTIEHWEDGDAEGEYEQYLISPRVSFKSGDRYSVTMGYNFFTSLEDTEDDAESRSGLQARPVTFSSDNNQYFFSFRVAF
jgi:hypothetical protein